MRTWLDLEGRFRLLVPRLARARLDAQWGAAGEHWHISGGVDPIVRKEYELLCGVAGRFLEQVYSPKDPSQADILAISDAKTRWYTLLKRFHPFQNMIYGEQQHPDGSSAGYIYSATLPSFVESSANLCLALHTDHPILERTSKWKWFHDNYGKAIVVGIVLTLVGALINLLCPGPDFSGHEFGVKSCLKKEP